MALWLLFCAAAARVALAMEGNDASLVHIEYLELAMVLRQIIQALQSSSANPSDRGLGRPSES